MTRLPLPDLARWLLCALLFVGVPMAVTMWETGGQRGVAHRVFAPVAAAKARKPTTPPPPVEPVALYDLTPEQAREFNAAIPFSRDHNPAARPFVFGGDETDLSRATDCLAAAEIYEAGDDAVGERAVAQVVLNRVRHPAFPKTVCGVVFQGQERKTGCQFTFSCDGALARTPSPVAWERAREIAKAALGGQVFKPVGQATHYHTNWVVPYWSSSLDKIVNVGTHLFFRWRGWWGTPPAFRFNRVRGEPIIPNIARLSPAHGGDAATIAPNGTSIFNSGGEEFAKARKGIAVLDAETDDHTFRIELPAGSSPDSWLDIAKGFCGWKMECRVMGWKAGTAPKAGASQAARLDSMSFSYMISAKANLVRTLWNCAQTPRMDDTQCMRRTTGRRPVLMAPSATPAPADGLSGVRRKERFETVKIVPPTSAAPSPGSIAPEEE